MIDLQKIIRFPYLEKQISIFMKSIVMNILLRLLLRNINKQVLQCFNLMSVCCSTSLTSFRPSHFLSLTLCFFIFVSLYPFIESTQVWIIILHYFYICAAVRVLQTYCSEDILSLISIRKRRNVSFYVVKQLVSIFRAMNLNGSQNKRNKAASYQ